MMIIYPTGTNVRGRLIAIAFPGQLLSHNNRGLGVCERDVVSLAYPHLSFRSEGITQMRLPRSFVVIILLAHELIGQL
jgi:hypothetical protein